MPYPQPFARLVRMFPWLARYPILVKAASFGAIGVVNAGIDASVFFSSRAVMLGSAAATAASGHVAAACGCAEPLTAITVVANVAAWAVAMSGSYVMNTFITFAAESGRRLRWKDYARFAASGVFGLVANTGTLVVMDDYVPIWAAKGFAILVGFVVNFGLSHFLVFRPRRSASD
jgi:putative flippase GtrA